MTAPLTRRQLQALQTLHDLQDEQDARPVALVLPSKQGLHRYAFDLDDLLAREQRPRHAAHEGRPPGGKPPPGAAVRGPEL